MTERGGGKLLGANLKGALVWHLLLEAMCLAYGKYERDEQTTPL